jgi:hypothetical protein
MFLDLQFDIPRMMEEAMDGKIGVHEKEHILCLYKNNEDELNALELTDEHLQILGHLENGPQKSTQFAREFQSAFGFLVEHGVILDLTRLD